MGTISMQRTDYDLTVQRRVGPLVYVGTDKHWAGKVERDTEPGPAGYPMRYMPETREEADTLMDTGDYEEHHRHVSLASIVSVTRTPAHVATYETGKREVPGLTVISYTVPGDKYPMRVHLDCPDSVHALILDSIGEKP